MIPPLSIGRGNSYKRKEVIGECTLYLGDCLEIMPDVGMVDHCITDPPFEAEAHTRQRRINTGKIRGTKKGDKLSMEQLPFEAMKNRDETAVEIQHIVYGWALAFCQAEAVQDWRKSFENAGAKYKRAMVWIKPDGMPQYSGDRPGMGYESIVAAWCGEGKSIWNGGGRHGVFTFNKNDNGGQPAPHPTTKPISLMRELVGLFTQPQQTVLDPYMGSGSTLVACARMNRKAAGIEINEDYFDIACRRVEDAYRQGDMFLESPKKPIQEVMPI